MEDLYAAILMWVMSVLFGLLTIRTLSRGEIFFGSIKGNDLKSKKEESSYWLFFILYALVTVLCILAAIRLTFFA